MKVVTFNLRDDNNVDKENRWQFRKGLVLDKISSEKPDLIGFQEVTQCMAEFLRKYLAEYLCVGCARNADYSGENNMIAIRKDAFELMSLETVWVSDTPYQPGSRFENANQSDCPRVCTHVMLRLLESNRLVHMFNTHLDHWSDESRERGARAVLDYVIRTLERYPAPVIITGDMNAYPDSKCIELFLHDEMLPLDNQTPNFPASYHGWGTKMDAPQIDYIFTNGMKAVDQPVAWSDQMFGKFLSDHNALCAYIDFA